MHEHDEAFKNLQDFINSRDPIKAWEHYWAEEPVQPRAGYTAYWDKMNPYKARQPELHGGANTDRWKPKEEFNWFFQHLTCEYNANPEMVGKIHLCDFPGKVGICYESGCPKRFIPADVGEIAEFEPIGG